VWLDHCWKYVYMY